MTETTKPAEISTGGFAASRLNATKHGILSRHVVLPWETAADYEMLLAELTAEYDPRGPTEGHLVETVATIMWRQQRVLLAEAAEYRRGLQDVVHPGFGTSKVIPRALVHSGTTVDAERVVDAVSASDAGTAEEYDDLARDEAITSRVLKLLVKGTAYDIALAALHEDTRDWWVDTLDEVAPGDDDEEETYRPTADGLRRFLKTEVAEWYASRRRELDNRPLIRSQAFGEAAEPGRLANLSRYETHLDRKLERTLGLLLRLKDLRKGTIEG